MDRVVLEAGQADRLVSSEPIPSSSPNSISMCQEFPQFEIDLGTIAIAYLTLA